MQRKLEVFFKGLSCDVLLNVRNIDFLGTAFLWAEDGKFLNGNLCFKVLLKALFMEVVSTGDRADGGVRYLLAADGAL